MNTTLLYLHLVFVITPPPRLNESAYLPFSPSHLYENHDPHFPSANTQPSPLTPSSLRPHFQSTEDQLLLIARMADVNIFTTTFQLVKSIHRDLYPAVDPSNPALSANGKVETFPNSYCRARKSQEHAGAARTIVIGRTAATLNIHHHHHHHHLLNKMNLDPQSSSLPIIIDEPSVKSLFSSPKVKAKCGKSPRPNQHHNHMDTGIDPRMFP